MYLILICNCDHKFVSVNKANACYQEIVSHGGCIEGYYLSNEDFMREYSEDPVRFQYCLILNMVEETQKASEIAFFCADNMLCIVFNSVSDLKLGLARALIKQ